MLAYLNVSLANVQGDGGSKPWIISDSDIFCLLDFLKKVSYCLKMCFCLREEKNSGTFSGAQTLVTVDESQGLSPAPPHRPPPSGSSVCLRS